MTLKIITLSVVISLGLMNCKSTKNGITNETSETEAMNDNGNVPKVTIDKEFRPIRDNDLFNVSSLNVDGDTLILEITYSGGCEEHEFELIFNGMYKKSLPPQADFFLKHNANGDACRKLITRTLKYDITSTRFEAGGNKELIVGLNNTDEQASYTW